MVCCPFQQHEQKQKVAIKIATFCMSKILITRYTLFIVRPLFIILRF